MCIEREMWYLYVYVRDPSFLHALSSIEPRFSCLDCLLYIYLWLFQSLCRINDVERFLVERMMDNRKYRLILYVLSILNIFQFIRNY